MESEAFKKFFTQDKSGKEFIEWCERVIEQGHRRSEQTLDVNQSFAFSQQAHGVRIVLNQIKTVINGSKKVKKPQVKEGGQT